MEVASLVQTGQIDVNGRVFNPGAPLMGISIQGPAGRTASTA